MSFRTAVLLACCAALPAVAEMRRIEGAQAHRASSYHRMSTPGYISNFDNAFAHVTYGGIWNTHFTIVNYRDVPVTVGLYLYNEDGSDATVPFAGNGSGNAWSLDIPALGTFDFETQFLPNSPSWVGSAELDVPCTAADLEHCGQVGGFAVFRAISGKMVQEAVVPLSTSEAQCASIAFNNRAGYSTGVAISTPFNLSLTSQSVTLTAHDGNGSVLVTDTFTMPVSGHLSFVAAQRYPALANHSGTITATTPSTNSAVAILGILANPTGAYTTLPSFQP